jgi:DNA polymerase-3 subunit delta'
MTSLVGNEAAQSAFLAAIGGGSLHHGWLIAGPEGVGKGRFARLAALRLLAEGMARGDLPAGLAVPDDNPTARIFASRAHPDYRELARLPKDPEKPDVNIARNITIAQVRGLNPMFATKPALSQRRVVVIDSIDDLERNAANALLKNLEEPPAGTIFLLVSHAPGRLLPTIRSRCRLLRFDPLDDAAVGQIVRAERPEASDAEIAALLRAGQGSPGRALGFAGLDLAALETDMARIARDGDPSNALRSKLSKALGAKAAQPRYEAFLARAPSFIAERARERGGAALREALDAYDTALSLAASAAALTLDAGATVFEMSGLIAKLSGKVRA